MGTNQNLTGAPWRKSSYSGDTGGNCIECTPLGGAAWRKSSYSGDTGGECIECAPSAVPPGRSLRTAATPEASA